MASKVTASVKYGAPLNEDFAQSDPWTVTLKYQGRRLTVPFYMGIGHNGAEPTADEVLECLLSDATAEDEDFEEWASNLGYDTDSRKAERTYKACVRIAQKLRKLLGDDFEDFMYGARGEELRNAS